MLILIIEMERLLKEKTKTRQGVLRLVGGLLLFLGSGFLLVRYFFIDTKFSRMLFKEVWLLIVFAFLFLIAGLLIAVLGVLTLLIDKDKYSNLKVDKKSTNT